MTNRVIRRVVVLGALAIIGIISVQSYWVMQAWDSEQRGFQQSVQIALRRVAENLAAYDSIPLPSSGLVTRKSSNYYIVNINNIIDAGLLEYYLGLELESMALLVDFEYAIYDCSSNEMVYGNYCSPNPSEDKELKKGLPSNLLTYDEYTYYFGVRFPSQTSFLLAQMPMSIFFTFLLFIAIIFFIYSMIVILRQKRLSEMQKDFINNMTHEFKTPISTIKVSSEVLLNSDFIKEDGRLHRYAKVIQGQNERLNRQVEKVLQLAAVEREGLRLQLESIDLHHLLEDTLIGIELKINAKEGQLIQHLDASQPIIQADKLHLTNILHNLLDNSIKYCKKAPIIKVSTKEENRQIHLTIEDNGIGIRQEHQAKIFRKFYRVPTGNRHDVKGFGLGLFYVYNICRAHAWKIELESEWETGTRISIIINR